MSKYDVKVYIPKDLYTKLDYISKIQNVSISTLIGQIFRDDNFTQLINVVYTTLKQLEGVKDEVEKMGASS